MPRSSPSVGNLPGCRRLRQCDHTAFSTSRLLRSLHSRHCAGFPPARLPLHPARSRNGLVEQCPAGCREGPAARQGNGEEGPGERRLGRLLAPACPLRIRIASSALRILRGDQSSPRHLPRLPPPPAGAASPCCCPHLQRVIPVLVPTFLTNRRWWRPPPRRPTASCS